MSDNKRIEALIALKMVQAITEQEEQELHSLLEKSPEYRRLLQEIEERGDLSEAYGDHLVFKRHKGFERVLAERALLRTPSLSQRVLRYAAVILLPLAVAASVLLWQRSDEADGMEVGPKPLEAIMVMADSKRIDLTTAHDGQLDVQEVIRHNASARGGARSPYIVSTNERNEFRVTLEDGTVVHLNYDSELHFPEQFGSRQRMVYLRGEAYVKVAKDARPFIIKTDDGIVRQYGTEFNVRAVRGEGTEVVLVRGSVGVYSHRDTTEIQMLTPGEKAAFAYDSEVHVEPVDTTPYVAWDSGQITFDNLTLERLMQVITKWYDIKVSFGDTKVAELRFTGVLDRSSTLDQVLRAIANVTGVEVKRTGKNVMIASN